MTPLLTFVYAFRDRDTTRVRLSLETLARQYKKNFEVVFVDYGSQPEIANEIASTVNAFSFASYHYIAHPGLLWNKSKALNFGIKQALGTYVFIADVDLLFDPDTTTLFETIANPEKGFLFKLSYIGEEVSEKITTSLPFAAIAVKHTGSVNGMLLASKRSFEEIHGFDEFFHFYGSEDVDLFLRLEHSGMVLEPRNELYFKHIWHPIYNAYDDSLLTETPRIFNIKRINREQYRFHERRKCTAPKKQLNWGLPVSNDAYEVLKNPTHVVVIDNIHEYVIHLLEVQIPLLKDEILSVKINDATDTSLRYKVKNMLKQSAQPYISMKEVNDLILSKIIYQYRDHNYSYHVASDLRSITFILQT